MHDHKNSVPFSFIQAESEDVPTNLEEVHIAWDDVEDEEDSRDEDFEERLRLNRAAVSAGIPLIDAAQWGMTGTLIVVDPGRTACLRCVYPQNPPFEELFPVVGAISAAVGTLAALEAIKILSHTGTPMFSVHMSVGIPADIHIAALRDEFMDYCDALNLDAVIEPIKG